VARAGLEELRLDYEDFLRHRGLSLWDRADPRRQALIDRRCTTADEVAAWVKRMRESGHGGQNGQCGQACSMYTPSTYPELAANAALTLPAVACSLLDRQLKALAKAFENEGGFTERLYKVRTEKRLSRSLSTSSTRSTKSRKD